MTRHLAYGRASSAWGNQNPTKNIVKTLVIHNILQCNYLSAMLVTLNLLDFVLPSS